MQWQAQLQQQLQALLQQQQLKMQRHPSHQLGWLELYTIVQAQKQLQHQTQLQQQPLTQLQDVAPGSCQGKACSQAGQASEYSNKLLLQAGQDEINLTAAAVTCLPVAAFSVLLPPGISPKPSGSNDACGPNRKCPGCSEASGLTVPERGHNCLLYVISRGQQPSEHAHTRDKSSTMARLPTIAEAKQQVDKLHKKSQAGDESKKRKLNMQ